jgi:hypothetical protein
MTTTSDHDLTEPFIEPHGAEWKAWLPPTGPECYEGGDTEHGAILGPWGDTFWPSEAEAEKFLLTNAPFAYRVRAIGQMLAAVMDDLRVVGMDGEPPAEVAKAQKAAGALDDALDLVDSAIRTLESEDDEDDEDDEILCRHEHCGEPIRLDDNGAGGVVWVHHFGSTVCHDNPPGSHEDGDTTTVAEPPAIQGMEN